MNELIPPFDLVQFLTEPWSAWEFGTTIRIVSLAFCVSASCGLIGVYLILRRLALVGDAISHSVLPGIVNAETYWASSLDLFVVLDAHITLRLAAFRADEAHHGAPEQPSPIRHLHSQLELGRLRESLGGHAGQRRDHPATPERDRRVNLNSPVVLK